LSHAVSAITWGQPSRRLRPVVRGQRPVIGSIAGHLELDLRPQGWLREGSGKDAGVSRVKRCDPTQIRCACGVNFDRDSRNRPPAHRGQNAGDAHGGCSYRSHRRDGELGWDGSRGNSFHLGFADEGQSRGGQEGFELLRGVLIKICSCYSVLAPDSRAPSPTTKIKPPVVLQTGPMPDIGGAGIPKTALTPGTRFLVVARMEAGRFTDSLPIGKR